MGLLRSEKMGYYDLIMPSDSAWAILNELGRVSSLQFIDLNSSETIFNRRYASYIRRCEESERRLRYLSQEMQRFKIETAPVYDHRAYLLDMDEMLASRDSPPQTYLEQLEQELVHMEEHMTDQVKSYEKLMDHYNELVEFGIVLDKTKGFFFPDENLYRGEAQEIQMSYNPQFAVLTGVVEKQDVLRFKRMVFRATRGNSLTLSVDVEQKLHDAKNEEGIEKSVFLILYPGKGGEIIESKLMRICDSFGAHRYNVPKDKAELERAIQENKIEQTSSYEITQRTHAVIVRTLQDLAQPRKMGGYSKIEEHRLYVLKEKAIYHHLNMFQLRNHIFYGNCWCPKKQAAEVTAVLNELTRRAPNLASGQLRKVEGSAPAHLTTPTYFKLNEFTRSFQEIVDTYGVPRYREANPTLLTCVTFPFLFGIMFGDIGHGLIMTIFASYLCFNADSIAKSKSEFLRGAAGARYLLLMMGLSAMYCGFIYNDFLGIPLDLFGSRWDKGPGRDQLTRDSVYPFGMDPMWYRASNELVFFNSFKMKLSVIFGVTQMIIGVLLKGLNNIHFGSKVDFFFEFIPQLVFISSIFGYMLFMIILKWVTDWNYNWTDSAPNLISVTMNMFLKMGSLDDQTPLWGDKEGQESIQLSLMLIAVICVPLMWLVKPLYENYHHKNANGHLQEAHPGLDIAQKYQSFEGEEHLAKVQEFDFGEEFVHQSIETIEYVLGCVSNTASYLRLWALSLAHGQLSKVFFDKCIASTIETGNPILVVVGFFVFANVTVGVLMAMDAMECFLHALRLHWVEFQSKFYKGDGIKFIPFSFEQVFTADAKS